MSLHLVLYQPEIPPNTGNLIRLCANSGAQLHLIEPLGFFMDDKACRRAGLDYHDLTHVTLHKSYAAFKNKYSTARIYACTTKASKSYADVEYQDGDMFLLGPETRGLPDDVLSEHGADNSIKIPMRPDSRSINLANAGSIILYEAWRQLSFAL